jgi:hypothetical protein
MVFQMATEFRFDTAHAQDIAVALDFFHTAPLLFDDLTCMDNLLERRGTACTHLVIGEEGAISCCPRPHRTRIRAYAASYCWLSASQAIASTRVYRELPCSREPAERTKHHIAGPEGPERIRLQVAREVEINLNLSGRVTPAASANIN